MPRLQPEGPKHPAMLLAASVKFKGAALPTHLDTALSLLVPVPSVHGPSAANAAAASSSPGPPSSSGKKNNAAAPAAAASAASDKNAPSMARGSAAAAAAEIPLLEAMDLVCGWSRGLERPLVLKRAALSVLTVCAAAKPAPLVVLLGVPGLTRLLMLASGNGRSSTTAARTSPSTGHSGAATHELHLQAAAVAALGHLSSAASHAAHANQPPSRSNTRPNTTATAGANNSRQSTARPTSAEATSSAPSRPQTAAAPAAAEAAAEATQRENAQVLALFQRFVNEANGMEKLSSLGKIWQTKVDVAKLTAATANADEVNAGAGANTDKDANAESTPASAHDAPEKKEAAETPSAAPGNQQQQLQQRQRRHQGGLTPEAIVYSGMVRSASIVVLNLSTLPMSEPAESHASTNKDNPAAAANGNELEKTSPESPELSEEEKIVRLHAQHRNKVKTFNNTRMLFVLICISF